MRKKPHEPNPDESVQKCGGCGQYFVSNTDITWSLHLDNQLCPSCEGAMEDAKRLVHLIGRA